MGEVMEPGRRPATSGYEESTSLKNSSKEGNGFTLISAHQCRLAAYSGAKPAVTNLAITCFSYLPQPQ